MKHDTSGFVVFENMSKELKIRRPLVTTVRLDYPIMDKAGLDLTLGRLGKNVARPEISYVQLLDNESFPEPSAQQLPSQTCWSLECSYKGNDQVFFV